MEPHLDGRIVALMQTRHAAELAALVERHGGVPVAVPCLREAPIEDSSPLDQAIAALTATPIDLAVFQTGVGTDRLLSAATRAGAGEAVLARLEPAVVLARGPKPLAVLLRHRVRVDRRTPEPHTTAEVVRLIEDDLAGRRVLLQHYGSPNLPLAALLRDRGADLLEVSTYIWRLPEDLGPIRSFLQRLPRGDVDLTVFTSASQVDNLYQVAELEGVEERLTGWLARSTEVAAVGPVCAAALRARGVPVRIEPVRPKMVPLVRALCEHVATRETPTVSAPFQ
jgi:uroporphyrinogen-III synthase